MPRKIKIEQPSEPAAEPTYDERVRAIRMMLEHQIRSSQTMKTIL